MPSILRDSLPKKERTQAPQLLAAGASVEELCAKFKCKPAALERFLPKTVKKTKAEEDL